uniref:Uncharacterized protein n=1 Tax=Oryza brachyantha TaxID=4533 RepID=J3LAS3_ORYBR
MPVRVEVTMGTRPGFLNSAGFEALKDAAMEAMRTADGAVVNTFTDLEDEFIACYEVALGKPVWTLGPFCLCNRDDDAMASRGNKLGIDQSAVTAWLDAMDTDSVIYVNFGSLARKVPKYLYEVGHGLEDSGKPFVWVVKESEVSTPEVQEWLSALEARAAGRGLVFLNERLAVDVLGVGVPIGVTAPVLLFGDEAMRFGRADVARAVSALMDGGEEADERRRRAKVYGEKARRAMEKGGSSYESLTQLIQSFTLQGGKQH